MSAAHECSLCEGDGEVGVFPFAWCVACRGTGLADNECAGCGKPASLSTLDRVPLDCIGIAVHVDCDTGHRFFDRRPDPIVWGTL